MAGLLVAGLLVLGLLLLVAARAQPGAARAPEWGLVGPYDHVDLPELHRKGVDVLLVEMSWALAEPARDRFDDAYLASIDAQARRLRAEGFKVVLNFGLQHAPGWLLTLPDARFTDQDGQQYLDDDVADLVFARPLRPLAEAYTREVFARLGTDFYAVRVGGGPDGELTYPGPAPSPDGGPGHYWAFTRAAAASNPVPDWRPCSDQGPEQTRRFLEWYMNSLVDFQNWQVDTLRRYYPGVIAVLYPSWGLNPGDVAAAANDDACGHTEAERSDDLQRGIDHARQVAALPRGKVAVWSTWAENTSALRALAELARPRHLQVFGENSGHDNVADLRATVTAARQFGLSALLWVRAPEALCGCSGYATMDEYLTSLSHG